MLNASPMRLVLLVLALPSVAAAQAPGMYDPTPPLAPPGMTPLAADTDEPPSPPAPAPALSPIELAAARDAADDRAYGTSTALTVPAGKVDASLRVASFGGIASVSAGVVDGLEVSADMGLVLPEDGAASYGVGAKLALVKKGGWGLAVEGSYHQMGDDGGGGAVGLWSLGGVVSGCTDRECSALVSLGGGVLGSTEGSGQTIPYGWASVVLGTGGFRPILEGSVLEGGVLGFLGARMGGTRVAFDLGIGFLGGNGEGGGLPIAGLSVRP